MNKIIINKDIVCNSENVIIKDNKITFNKETTKFILYPAGEGTKKSFKQIEKLGFKKEPLVISNPLKNKEKVSEQLKDF